MDTSDAKGITLSGWIENRHKDTTPGDNMCLYLLACMYYKHIYVHNKMFYWCMAIHKIRCEVDLDLIQDCEIELVFIQPWVFGEVKRVRVPKGHITVDPVIQSKLDNKDTGITENAKDDSEPVTKDCTVSLTQIEGFNLDSQLTSSDEGNTPTRCTGRKCTIPDYSKVLNYDDDLEMDNTLPPYLVKWKWPTNLLRKPSRNRQKM